MIGNIDRKYYIKLFYKVNYNILSMVFPIFAFKSNYSKWSKMMDVQQQELIRLHGCNHNNEFVQLLMNKHKFEYDNQKLIENSSLTEWLNFTNVYIDKRIKYIELLQRMSCEQLKSDFILEL